jgi:hypothetical protein
VRCISANFESVSFSSATGVIANLRLLFARQAKGKRKLMLTRCFTNKDYDPKCRSKDVNKSHPFHYCGAIEKATGRALATP